MSRTRLIYFLSAIVLIIGCFALNTSYSLFIDNDSSSIVDTIVPVISLENENPNLTIDPSKEYIVKQTIKNEGNVDSYFALLANITTDSISREDLTIQPLEIENNDVYGSISPNNTKDIYLYIKNNSSSSVTINFLLDESYLTLSYDNFITKYNNKDSHIDNSSKYPFELPTTTIPFEENKDSLSYTILNNYAKSSDAIMDNVGDLFEEDSYLLELPLNTTTEELSVPSPSLDLIYIDMDGLENGFFKSTDDLGTSYFYRGKASNNYVNFAGFTWRVVRINGDGSIRLILDGTLDQVKRDGETNYAGSLSSYNESGNDNAYVGYMYGLTGQTTYSSTTKCLMLVDGTITDEKSSYSTKATCEAAGGVWTTNSSTATHANVVNSTIKDNLDTFYDTYIGGTTYNFENYLSTNSVFCNDKSSSSAYILELYEVDDEDMGYYIDGKYTYYNSIYGTNLAYYGAHSRLMYGGYSVIPGYESSIMPEYMLVNYYDIAFETYYGYTTPMVGYEPSENWSSIPTPKLECSANDISNYLSKPIGLLTADELVLAGSTQNINTSTYLNDSTTLSSTWWTMTPYGFPGGTYTSSIAKVFAVSSSTNLMSTPNVTENAGVRPVINLKSDILWESGDGTQESPYTVKLS